MKFKIFKFENVTSTNDVAINLIKNQKKEIGCVYAHEQTKGRGTHGKLWISQKGNLFISLFFHLKNQYPAFNEFSIINSLIISDVLKSFCNNENVSLKFPNDIFLNGKKICGILQEVITFGKKKFLIIGIGINIISHPKSFDLYQATNLLFETKKKQNIKKIINLIIISYEKFFKNLYFYNYKTYKKKAEIISIR
tara:strand:- start:166 stop:750 length:585 start_codon:yes stop_codon:yes gene_type:complete